jgi:hypothetical protein
MTLTSLPSKPLRTSRPRSVRTVRQREQAGRATDHATDHGSSHQGALGRYTDPADRPREVVVRTGSGGSVLVIDRDATTLGDRRLVAHLAADEPRENAQLVCRHYLSDPRGRRCRRVTPEDLERAPLAAEEEDSERRLASSSGTDRAQGREPGRSSLSEMGEQDKTGLVDQAGYAYRLEPLSAGLSIPELRWCCHPPREAVEQPRPASVREVIAGMESYEPVRTLTVAALARHRDDPSVSVAVLRAELERIDASRIVLNRGLRRAVLSAMRSQGLSMSEIALRCGRVKYDSRGNASGETTWLARRVGISPEGGGSAPTPWIHSEVLALIARTGLGISPREVELG